jgi:hypothetical protein
MYRMIVRLNYKGLFVFLREKQSWKSLKTVQDVINEVRGLE